MNNAILSKKNIVFLLAISCSYLVAAQKAFSDVTESAGISHSFKILEGTFGGGAAVLDYNQDGWEDIFLIGGADTDMLYRNNGDGTFTDVSATAGLGVLSPFVTQGAIAADVNKDSYTDLFLTTIAKLDRDEFKKAANILLLGSKEGVFSDQSAQYGLDRIETFSTGATFGDFNRDGYPDLYVGNYFTAYSGNLDKFSGPQLDEVGGPANDLLYLNQGGEKFVEVSTQVGMTHHGFSFGGVWSDYDNDNDLDLLIVNDFGFRTTPNLLYRNEYPRLAFTDVSEETGFDFGINAMGISVGDCNMDGWMDYFITNMQASLLLLNQGGNKFLESSEALGTWYPHLQTEEGYRVTPVSWGANFFDVDSDMDLDLYVTNGALNPSVPPNPNLFFENTNGQFQESAAVSQINDPSVGRGSVHFDYDNDGDLDLLIINQAAYEGEETSFDWKGTRLYRNESSGQNWLNVQLQGQRSATSGMGSRLELYVDDKMLIREIDGGSSHESHNTTITHFGLADYLVVDSLIIKWSAGTTQMLHNIPANQKLVVQESSNSGPAPPNKASIAISPNPVSSTSVIQFELEKVTAWSMDLYNALGAKVSQLSEGTSRTGLHIFDQSEGFTSGIYFVTLTTATGIISEKVLLR